MTVKPITDAEFALFQRFIFDAAGITMADAKKALVMGRLGKRLMHHGMDTFGAYFQLLTSGDHPQEVQLAVDLLTTNETYFFREIKHFDFLRQQVQAARSRSGGYRLWSAASSTGEEAYSMAMVMADLMPSQPWEIVGTDISTRVVQAARRGLYPMERGRHIPPDYLRRFCRKGIEEYTGYFLIERSLRNRVGFAHANLNDHLPEMGLFDMVWLRNVMIYFNLETKREVVARVLGKLKPGGYFCVGHSESLNDLTQAVRVVAPSIYQKVG